MKSLILVLAIAVLCTPGFCQKDSTVSPYLIFKPGLKISKEKCPSVLSNHVLLVQKFSTEELKFTYGWKSDKKLQEKCDGLNTTLEESMKGYNREYKMVTADQLEGEEYPITEYRYVLSHFYYFLYSGDGGGGYYYYRFCIYDRLKNERYKRSRITLDHTNKKVKNFHRFLKYLNDAG